jgi:hypothetical protein
MTGRLYRSLLRAKAPTRRRRSAKPRPRTTANDLHHTACQGQTAARNMLGRRERFDAVPFFWTEQYDFGLAYVGHAERWDQADIDGQLDAETQKCTITYRRRGKKLAVAIVHRDLEGLRAEVEFERTMATTE